MSDFDQSINYPQRYQAAILGMLRGILEEVVEQGVPGDHAFYITFSTTHPEAELSQNLLKSYPEHMTIVLQNQFWGLRVDDEGFDVTLRFGGSPETLRVPWKAMTGFADPSAEFGIQLQSPEIDSAGEVEEGAEGVEGDEAERPALAAGPTEPRPSGERFQRTSRSPAQSENEERVQEDGEDGETVDSTGSLLDFEDFKKRT